MLAKLIKCLIIVIGTVYLFSVNAGQNSWVQVQEQELNAEQQLQLERARSARQELGSRLMARVLTATQQNDRATAVEVCSQDAERITQEVAQKYQLQIGRTSHRLRNLRNVAPDWARPYVDQQRIQARVLLGSQQRLAALFPIQLAQPCVSCHGTREQISPQVKQSLAAFYPRDQATGFAVGDLRGWFWVVVP